MAYLEDTFLTYPFRFYQNDIIFSQTVLKAIPIICKE